MVTLALNWASHKNTTKVGTVYPHCTKVETKAQSSELVQGAELKMGFAPKYISL